MQTEVNAFMHALRRSAVVLAAAAALPLLWAGRPGDPADTGPQSLVVAAAAWAAWALTGYLAVAVGMAALATRVPAAGPTRRTARLVPAVVRRAVDVAVGAGVAATVVTAAAPPVLAAPVPSPPPVIGPLEWPGLAPATPSPSPPPVPTPTPSPRLPMRRPTPAVHDVVVRPHDTLWGIAARALGPTATPARVAVAWPRWWAANRAVIGPDPGLIRPGQRLTPPAADPRSPR